MNSEFFINSDTLKSTIIPSLLYALSALNENKIISSSQDFEIIQKTAKNYLKEGQLKTSLEKQCLSASTNQEKNVTKRKATL